MTVSPHSNEINVYKDVHDCPKVLGTFGKLLFFAGDRLEKGWNVSIYRDVIATMKVRFFSLKQ